LGSSLQNTLQSPAEISSWWPLWQYLSLDHSFLKKKED
jgi:hypothetical protein